MLNRTSTLILLALLSCALLFGAYINGNLDIEGYLEIDEMADPANPAADHLRIYANDVGGTTKLMYRDSAGTETEVGAGGGGSTFAYSTHYITGSLGARGFFHDDNTGTEPTYFINAGTPPGGGLRLQDGSAETWWTRIILPPDFDATGNITLTFITHQQNGTQTGNTFDLSGTVYVFSEGDAFIENNLPTADADGPVTCSGDGVANAGGKVTISCTLTPTLVTNAASNGVIQILWDRATDSAAGNVWIRAATVKMPVSP